MGKMDSPIEKWNLIIGNLALKQVRAFSRLTCTVQTVNKQTPSGSQKNLNTLTPYFASGFLPSKETEILSRLQVSIFTQTLIKTRQSEVSI